MAVLRDKNFNVDYSKCDQCKILSKIWTSLGKNLDNSDPDSCCSGVPGVTCDSDRRVTGIYWSSRGLEGSFDEIEMKNFKSLEHL
jgi:hypothetical protein